MCVTRPPSFDNPHCLFANLWTRLFWLLDQREEDSSPTRNAWRVRSLGIAVAAIEKLDFHVLNGDQLMGARLVTPMLSSVVTKSFFCSTATWHRIEHQASGGYMLEQQNNGS
jgi:hypothetical protein